MIWRYNGSGWRNILNFGGEQFFRQKEQKNIITAHECAGTGVEMDMRNGDGQEAIYGADVHIRRL